MRVITVFDPDMSQVVACAVVNEDTAERAGEMFREAAKGHYRIFNVVADSLSDAVDYVRSETADTD